MKKENKIFYNHWKLWVYTFSVLKATSVQDNSACFVLFQLYMNDDGEECASVYVEVRGQVYGVGSVRVGWQVCLSTGIYFTGSKLTNWAFGTEKERELG